MKKIERILACIDFSEYSDMTLEYAVRLARLEKAEIVVYHVINDENLKYFEMASIYLPEQVSIIEHQQKLVADSTRELEEFVKQRVPDDKPLMVLKVEQGRPYACILETITAENIDLVIMANKGRSNIAGFLLGSSAEKVFRHSPVPVLSVRNKANFKR